MKRVTRQNALSRPATLKKCSEVFGTCPQPFHTPPRDPEHRIPFDPRRYRNRSRMGSSHGGDGGTGNRRGDDGRLLLFLFPAKLAAGRVDVSAAGFADVGVDPGVAENFLETNDVGGLG